MTTYEQLCQFYRDRVNRALDEAFLHYDQVRQWKGLPLSDEMTAKIALRETLGRLSEEASAHVETEIMLSEVLGNGSGDNHESQTQTGSG